ncbi:MAG: hypothetical protein NZ522_07140, partial [Chitinophagales bacterium]|nr:hypothetical protein [Chitinophagales bacterium]
MKRFLLALGILATLTTPNYGQFNEFVLPEATSKGNFKVYQLPKNLVDRFRIASSGRAQQDTFLLDYPEVDGYNATQSGIDFIPNYAEDINERYDSSKLLSARTVGVIFDTIVIQDPNTQAYNKVIPLSKVKMTVDSVYIIYNYPNTPVVLRPSDSLTIKVYKWPVTFSNNTGYNSVITSPPLYYFTFKDSALLPLRTAPTALRVLSVPIGVSFNKGDRFLITVSYDADTASKFSIGCAFADSCNSDQFLLKRSTIPGRSIYYLNFSVNNTGWDNGSLSVPTFPLGCRFWLWQNWQIIPLVRAEVDFGVSAKASKTIACPGDQVTLTANGFGSDDISYQWFTSRGTLTSPNDKETTLITDSTTTVFVVATDNIT